ncbi:MAG TPA: site-specific DNA-methyltransferase, partial [Pseudomonadota bacterium]|nr:site-specific DNA-methyltransferase [Pseudomonadota bacterium]
MAKVDDAIVAAIRELLPKDGTPLGNQRLREWIAEDFGIAASESAYNLARDWLLLEGFLTKGMGRGGSVRRTTPSVSPGLTLEAQEIPADAKRPKPKQMEAQAMFSQRKTGEPTKPARKGDEDPKVIAYRHDQKRRNNPDVGVVTPETDPDQPKTKWAYDPHLDPALQFDVGRAEIERLIDDALASGDDATMRAALETLKRMGEPYLNWAGKSERTSFDVDTVSLHVHERIDPATILAVVQKRMKKEQASGGSQTDMFRAWFEDALPYREAIEFYKHDRGWSNRLVAGDSLLVMNSLLQKEGMAGQVQMIYIDPPYGIKYGSNFQPFVNKRDVKDRSDQDLTQEPEMIKAFRDTWELGIHSYLTYLRDRLLLAKELLHESGSVFVQISDENLHHVREAMDEVFGSENFVSQITFSKTSGATVNLLPSTADYILWSARDKAKVKFHSIYLPKEMGGDGAEKYDQIELGTGLRRRLSVSDRSSSSPQSGERIYRLDNLMSQSEGREKGLGAACWFPVSLGGRDFLPNERNRWKTNEAGIQRLLSSNRIQATSNSLAYVRFIEDFPAFSITNIWTDIGGIQSRADPKVYVVQTAVKAVERCLLMTTDPGDLVLDPTCGSGTTASVAEKWGRRWITCDTSRVAVTLAKQRLMTAGYDYFELKYPHEGLKGGFIYKTVPHVTLKSIANNPEIDEIYASHHPLIETALRKLNESLKKHPPSEQFVVTEGGRKGTKLYFAKSDALLEWEVPFDSPKDWSEDAKLSAAVFHGARQTMQKAMDRSIASHADQETLYDQPAVSKNKLRITGPFTVEAVPFPTVLALDEQAPAAEADVSIARSGESSRQHRWRDELLKTGIRGKGGQMLKFAELETLPSGEGFRHLHCNGSLDTGERIVVSFGPEHAALEQRQVELAMREAGELFPRPKMIVFCAFNFDPEAAKDIDATKGIVALKAQMNT